ncbi:unnamed protein product [Phytophthora fragariaefolia]|uniref:Unnamed protein product n=1 Tax=Phytophthora fragariaefolia TaxID=1490495 RepID=A0A9W7D4F5_9STRA|nr:unnamed protein product [Phytophthora fragariaefolia]
MAPSALWVAMCCHMMKVYQAPTMCLLLVSDNFYTRHTLAKAILAFTDGEMRTLGTARIGLQGKWNGGMLEAAKDRCKGVERGTWELIVADDLPVDWEKQQKLIRTHRNDSLLTNKLN